MGPHEKDAGSGGDGMERVGGDITHRERIEDAANAGSKSRSSVESGLLPVSFGMGSSGSADDMGDKS
eukprot:7076644-Karenia_brevis.AAC.1